MPFKRNYLQEYAKAGSLNKIVTDIKTATSRVQGVVFKGFDMVTHDITIPNNINTSQFSSEISEYLEKNKGKTIPLPLHITSVFEVDGKEVAGPMFGSLLNQTLQTGLDGTLLNKHVSDRIGEILDQDIYDSVIIATPYFSRWDETQQSDSYINASTQNVFINHAYYKTAWTDRLKNVDTKGKFMAGTVDIENHQLFGQNSTISSYSLLSKNDNLKNHIQFGGGPVTRLFTEVQQIFSYANTELNIMPDKQENEQSIALMKWLVSETTDIDLLNIFRQVSDESINLHDFSNIVNTLCQSGYIIITPSNPTQFLEKLHKIQSDSQIQTEYHNPSTDLDTKQEASIDCTYLTFPSAPETVSLMVARDSVGGAALNPNMHTHPGPSFSVLTEGEATFQAIVPLDGHSVKDVKTNLLANKNKYKIVEHKIKPGSIMVFSEGMGHRFNVDNNNPFSLMVAQRGDMLSSSPEYSQSIEEKKLRGVEIISPSELWAKKAISKHLQNNLTH